MVSVHIAVALSNNGVFDIKDYNSSVMEMKLNHIINMASQYSGISVSQIKNPCRKTGVVNIRRAVHGYWSEHFIKVVKGRRTNIKPLYNILNQDHSTTIYSIKMHYQYINRDDSYTECYNGFLQFLKNNNDKVSQN